MSLRIICVFSQKGGPGKTTTAMGLAETLHKTGKHVLLLDTDPQASADKWEKRNTPGYQRFPVQVHHISEGFSDGPSFAERVLDVVEPIRNLDYLIIDTPPYLAGNVQMRAALEFSHLALIPFEPHVSNLDALEELFPVVEDVQVLRGKDGKPPLKVFILPNLVGSRRASEKKLLEQLPVLAPWPVMKNHVKNFAAIGDAWNYRTSIFGLSGSKEARANLANLAEEIEEVLQA